MKPFVKNSVIFASFLTFVCKVYCDCDFPNNKPTAADGKEYKKLTPLLGKRYKVPDPKDEYTYFVGICTDAISGNAGKDTKEGIVQVEKGNSQASHVIGRYTNANVMTGTNWVYLEYGGGDKYTSPNHCDKAERKAVILFTCDPDATDATPMRMLEEQTDVVSGCYYLFELATPDVCENPPSGSFLSIGSIILIVFFLVASVYLIAGGLYQRFILGAKGIEQIPNYEFWKDFGNLQADGCEFVCRSTDARRSSPYKGLGDDQLEEPEERDDNLLPM